MRDLDKRDLVTGDFILVSGDIVANIDLNLALEQHRARREKDKNAIMTMLLREVGTDYKSKSQGRKPFFFIDPQQDRCLYYDEISKQDKGDGRFHLDEDILAKAEIDIRGDLVDCQIDICTPDVLGLWSDNFDYKSIRSSFLRGVLQDYELNGKTIHTHIIEEGYVSRVASLRAYDAVTQDIINRWTYPFTPDCNLLPDQNYRLVKGRVYVETGVVLARGSIVQTRSIVGKDTSVGDHSLITNSVIGRRCQIGKNVTINGSYLWDDIVIGDNSVIDSTVIANEVVIGSNCRVEKGSLLSYRVRISHGTTLPPKTRLLDTQESFTTSKPKSDQLLVGSDGVGRSYEPESDTESVISNNLMAALSRNNSSESLASISTLHSDADSDVGFHLASSGSLTPDPEHPSHVNQTFITEAITSIQDGIIKGDDPDTVKLELLGQRLTHDASDANMRDAISRALIRSVFVFIDPPQTTQSTEAILSSSPSTASAMLGGSSIKALQPKEAASRVYGTYSTILIQLGIFDHSSEQKSDQVAVLREIEAECAARLADGSAPGDKVLLFALNELHQNLEVVQDEGVLQWWDAVAESEGKTEGEKEKEKEAKAGGDGDGAEVRRLAKVLVDHIREDSESETDSEEEESEEDEDEEEDDDDEED
jgi:translation initiation factor eIF-2B subunit epsilon